MKGIAESIVVAIKDSNFHGIGKDGLEVVIDSVLKDGVTKDIPFIGMLSGLLNLQRSVKDQLFLNKIINFLLHSEAATPEERLKVIQEIDDSNEHRIKVGEKLMYIIDKFDDHIKAGIFGYLYREFTLKKLKYNDLLRCALVLDKCLVVELDFFLKSEMQTGYNIEDHSELVEWGLLSLAQLDMTIEKDDSDQSKLEGAQLALKISKAGSLLREHLKEYQQDQLQDLAISRMTLPEVQKYFDKIRKYPEYCREAYLKEFIIRVCNNYEISDENFSKIVTMYGRGKIMYVHFLNEDIQAYIKDQNERGNEFNLVRWQRFYDLNK